MLDICTSRSSALRHQQPCIAATTNNGVMQQPPIRCTHDPGQENHHYTLHVNAKQAGAVTQRPARAPAAVECLRCLVDVASQQHTRGIAQSSPTTCLAATVPERGMPEVRMHRQQSFRTSRLPCTSALYNSNRGETLNCTAVQWPTAEPSRSRPANQNLKAASAKHQLHTTCAKHARQTSTPAALSQSLNRPQNMHKHPPTWHPKGYSVVAGAKG